MSVKVNLRSTESKLHLKNLSLLRHKGAQASSEEKKGIESQVAETRKMLGRIADTAQKIDKVLDKILVMQGIPVGDEIRASRTSSSAIATVSKMS